MNESLLGEIDTLNEKFQAEVYYEARWSEKLNISTVVLTPQQQSQLLNERLAVRIAEYNPKTHWTPLLFIENAIGQIGEQENWFTLKRSTSTRLEPLSPPVVNMEICEHRRLKGVFWEKLELNHVRTKMRSSADSFLEDFCLVSCWCSRFNGVDQQSSSQRRVYSRSRWTSPFEYQSRGFLRSARMESLRTCGNRSARNQRRIFLRLYEQRTHAEDTSRTLGDLSRRLISTTLVSLGEETRNSF